MSQNSGPFLVSSHGHPGFNPRLPSSSSLPSLKRIVNGSMSFSNSSNTSVGPNMNVSSSPSPSTIRPSNSMGSMKSNTIGMNPLDKSNSMPYSSRYTRKVWPMSRNIHDKNIRGHDDHESPYLRSNLPPSHSVPPDTMNNSSFTIEPSTEDDEGDDICFSSRHMTAARFQRNQRFLQEIFNEVCIPDLRSNVSVDRILTLRRQVNALKTHRETFQKDLKELEEKHVEKKRKFLEANDKFYSEYAEASSTNLSQEKTNELLQKYETMEKLQKEKQLLLQQQQQQQQAVAIPPQSQIQSLPSTTTVSQTTTSVAMKTESAPIIDTSQQQTLTPPPPPIQPQLPSSQPVSTSLPIPQPVPAALPVPQSIPNQLPSSQPAPVQSSSSSSSSQSVQSQIPSSQSIQTQLPPPPPPPPSSVMQQVSSQQHHQTQSVPTPQGYPIMHPGSGYSSAPGYGHHQQTQYRPVMNQRPTPYPSNVPWQHSQQQQQQQQQWQANTYDPRYYNPYPPNIQWSPQQQWPPNQTQQQIPQMRGGPPQQQQQQQQQQPMYVNGVHYGYGNTNAGWNPNTHLSQQYGYPQNPSYDPSLVSTMPQQQYYPQSQMHNPSQNYDYGPPLTQQQQQQQQQQIPSQQLPQMN